MAGRLTPAVIAMRSMVVDEYPRSTSRRRVASSTEASIAGSRREPWRRCRGVAEVVSTFASLERQLVVTVCHNKHGVRRRSMTSGFTRQLAGIGEDGLHLYTCPLCEAMCGLEIQVEDGKVAGIRGNRADTWSAGHLCPKGATLGALHEDPDRIRQPMIKVDG